jgi:ketosteroid isomerase-like protein
MSQENVDVVREMYADFQRGGWDAVLAHLPPEFEWEADPRHPKAGIYRGLEAYRAFLEELEEPFERTDVETQQFFDAGDQVLAFLKVRRLPRGSSSVMEIKVATLWTLRAGKPVRGRFFANRGEGLKALRRSEQDAHADS